MCSQVWYSRDVGFFATFLPEKLSRSQKEVEALKMRLYAAGADIDPQVATTAIHGHSRLNGGAGSHREGSGSALTRTRQDQARGMSAALMTPDRRREHELEQSILESMKNSRLYGGTGQVGGNGVSHRTGRSEGKDRGEFGDLDDSDDDGGAFDGLQSRLASIRKKVDIFHHRGTTDRSQQLSARRR